MSDDRGKRRRDKAAQKKASTRSKVFIPIPDEFLDVDGEPWIVRGVDGDLDLADVIAHTVRRCPVKTGEDAERTLDIFMAIRDRDGDTDYIEMDTGDFEWMISHFKEVAHTFWMAPDARYLIRYLENVKMTKPPQQGEDEGKEAIHALPAVADG